MNQNLKVDMNANGELDASTSTNSKDHLQQITNSEDYYTTNRLSAAAAALNEIDLTSLEKKNFDDSANTVDPQKSREFEKLLYPKRQESRQSRHGSISDAIGAPSPITAYCFDCLIAKLTGLPIPRGQNLPRRDIPVFVKWTKGPNEEERGFKGSFNSYTLRERLQTFAISSATKDSRFPPIELNEIPDLQVTVTLILNFENTTDILDWELGLHGVFMRFIDKYGEPSAVHILPEGVIMNGWTKLDTIDALVRKTGFEGGITPEYMDQIRLKRFKAKEVRMSFQEYKESRQMPKL